MDREHKNYYWNIVNNQMTDIQTKAQQKIQELLNNVYHSLAKHPLISEQQRQLLQQEQDLMINLQQGSFLYDVLLRTLAIDSYCSSIMNQVNLYGQLCGMLTSTLQCFQQLGSSLTNSGQKRQLLERYNKSNQSIVQCVRIVQQMLPKNPYIQTQNKLIQSATLDSKIEESIITKLRKQNQELRKKSQSNQLQITNMQGKLTKLLKQHEGCQRGQPGNTVFNVQLRQQLSFKEAQIERMNQEFCFEIEKYNTVFQAMKRQLQQMKGYQNVDLIEQIQLLETQIVRLREERQRDQIIIRQLRTDNTMFSSAGYYSPRQSGGNRFPNPRYNY